MDDARAAGLKVAVCSAATKSSVVFTLKNLLGEQRFSSLDVFLAGKAGVGLGQHCAQHCRGGDKTSCASTASSVLLSFPTTLYSQLVLTFMTIFVVVLALPAGDDVDKKKPDPKIYNVAAQKLGLDPADCLVVEDSTIGLQAALGAGMRCIITYTPSTKQQVSLGTWEGARLGELGDLGAGSRGVLRRRLNYESSGVLVPVMRFGEGCRRVCCRVGCVCHCRRLVL